MVEGDPDLARHQRLLHEIVGRGFGVHMRPDVLERAPHLLGLGRAEGRDHAAGEGRIEIALEEARQQPARPGGEAEARWPVLSWIVLAQSLNWS